jgi:hypothetical protein
MRVKKAIMEGESGYSIAKRLEISQMAVSNIKRGLSHYSDCCPDDWKPVPTSKMGRKPKTPLLSAKAA